MYFLKCVSETSKYTVIFHVGGRKYLFNQIFIYLSKHRYLIKYKQTYKYDMCKIDKIKNCF